MPEELISQILGLSWRYGVVEALGILSLILPTTQVRTLVVPICWKKKTFDFYAPHRTWWVASLATGDRAVEKSPGGCKLPYFTYPAREGR